MAQALLDLYYYKCGHCSQKFNSLAAFAKHQRELHTPKHAPTAKHRKLKGEEESCIPGETSTCLETKKSPNFEFVLKVKLCQDCANTVKIDSGKVLVAPMCSTCLLYNGYI